MYNIRMYVYVYMHMHMYMYMYVYVYMYIYIYCTYIWSRVKIVYETFRGVPDVWNEGAS